MTILLTIIHVIVCFILIGVVLLQSGKAADLAGAFGGMGSQTAFGPRGSATVLSKATTIAAAVFMITSLSLSVIASRGGSQSTGGSTVLDKLPAQAPATKGGSAAPASTPAVPIQVQTPAGGASVTPTPAPAPAQTPAQAPAKK